ncbi:putative 60S ribosomal protein L13a-4-like [Capsicum annuum]|nr:putative 60S ribosomal protein L13a-4-like [Capsicum annuum]
MGNEEDKAYSQHQKWKKRTKSAGFPSNSMQDLNFTIPLLPAELIPLEIQGVNIKDCNLDSLFNDSVTEVSHLGHRMISDGLYNELPSSITILSSVNGLICLADSKDNLFLWNPSNRKYKKLPCPSATLWFETARMYGFGYDEFHDDYKLLGPFCIKGKFGRGELKIYSLKSDSWGNVDDCQLRKCKSREEVYISGILVKGKLNWPNAKLKDSSLRYSEVIDFDEFPKIAIYVESLVCPFSKEEAADATKHKRLKKLQSRKPSDKELFGNKVVMKKSGLEGFPRDLSEGRLGEQPTPTTVHAGIGSSRQAEAIDSVQLAAVSQQIAQLTRAVAQSIAQNEVTRKTVEELKKQMLSMPRHRRRRHRSPSPDSSSEEETESDEEFVGSTP